MQAVPDGAAALDAATTQPPDLIVSDVMMPGMDGLQLVAALRAGQRTARVPVLLLSARAGQQAAIEGLAAGADDYLVEPFSAEELLARVEAHLRLGRARREAEERLQLLQQATVALSAAGTPVQVAEAGGDAVRPAAGDARGRGMGTAGNRQPGGADPGRLGSGRAPRLDQFALDARLPTWPGVVNRYGWKPWEIGGGITRICST